MNRRYPSLVLALLVLAQSGLAVGHCHDVQCGSPNEGTRHVHLDVLFDLDTHSSEPDHESCPHDEWTVSDPGTMALDASSGPSPSAVVAMLTLADQFAASASLASPHPLGLPPPLAGPGRPLYLTLCTLRN